MNEVRSESPKSRRAQVLNITPIKPLSAGNLDRGYNFGLLTGHNTTIDTTVKASHVFVAGGSNSEILTFFTHFLPCPGAGNNPVDCAQPFATGGLNTGDQVYIQWRARYSPEMLNRKLPRQGHS